MELHSLCPGNDSLNTTNMECSNEGRKRVHSPLLRAFDCTQSHLDDSEGSVFLLQCKYFLSSSISRYITSESFLSSENRNFD